MTSVVENEEGYAAATRVCRCPGCAAGLEPFTVANFREWALGVELDNGEAWVVEPYFEHYLEDYFTGVPENWLIVPEGNAKTTSSAGLAVYLLEHRSRAAIPWGASSRDQAEIGYRQAEGLVLSSPRLRSLMKCQEGYRRIKNSATGGRIQIFAADDAHADGIIPTDAFLDELHRAKNLRLYRTWRGKLLKRGGQMSTFSTAGEAGSEFEETRERIRQETPVVETRPGFVRCRSDQISFHEYAVPEGGDVDDMEVVKLANPFSGLTVEKLAAKHASPTMTPQHWSRFVCNLSTRSTAAAITEMEWHNAATAEPVPVFDDWWLGIDVGWKWDTTAIVPLAWLADDHRRFAPATIIEPPRDGSSLNPAVIRQAVEGILGGLRVSTVVMDMHRAEELAAWLSDDLGLTVIDRSQSTKSASEDFERFMEALRQGWIRHSGDAGFRAHALNAVARLLPSGGARFERPSQTRIGGNQDARVIDALDAASFVHSVRCEWKPVARYRSVGF